MSLSDLIADQLTIIRNGLRVGKKSVIVKKSGTIEGILKIILDEGFIENYKVIADNKQGLIKVYLKYTEDEVPVIEQLKRISKPGRREYVHAQGVKPVRGGIGISIVSTSKGLMTDAQAREAGIGGEVICQIW